MVPLLESSRPEFKLKWIPQILTALSTDLLHAVQLLITLTFGVMQSSNLITVTLSKPWTNIAKKKPIEVNAILKKLKVNYLPSRCTRDIGKATWMSLSQLGFP